MAREPLILTLQRARAAGVTISRTAKNVVTLDIPPDATEPAAALHGREQQISALFDWRQAPVTKPAPCLLCTRPALLRDPAEHTPAHKVCVDALLHGPAH